MIRAADQFVTTIILKEALAVLLTLIKDDRTFWSTQIGSSEEPIELDMLTSRSGVATTSWSLFEGSHEVLAPGFREEAIAAVERMWSLISAHIFSLCWLGPTSYRTNQISEVVGALRRYFHFHVLYSADVDMRF